MRVLTLATEREASRAAALLVAAAASAKPDLVLGLPTGKTAIALYDALADLRREDAIDLSRARGFNLDELVLPAGDPRTFRAFMERHSWSRIGLDPARCAILDSATAEPERECARYETALEAAGGFDLALLGIGVDGHVAYNLPGTARDQAHVVELPVAIADSLSVAAASRPLRGMTLGLGALSRARRVLLLALTADKARAVRALIEGPEDPRWPCTALRAHPQLDVVLTEQAAGAAA